MSSASPSPAHPVPQASPLSDEKPPPASEEPSLPPGTLRRITFVIDPKTPLKDLLPAAPKTASRKPALLGDDLSQAPESGTQHELLAG